MSNRRVRFFALAGTIIFAATALLAGCQTLGYYAQSVSGHLQLMSMRKPVDRVIADQQTSEDLRQRLLQAEAIREFAHRELDLPGNGSYQSYVDLDRPFVSWTVIAAPEFSLEPKVWCFPLIGCVAYRGYFHEAEAKRFAGDLAAKNYDVFVSGVQAYSTLGWFDDPLLNTMIRLPEHRLAGLMFHELAHQRLYVPSDSAFNEAYAVVVERAGLRRWLAKTDDAKLNALYETDQERRAAFLQLIGRARSALERLYALALPDQERRAEKAAIFHRLRSEYQSLRQSWNGYAGYDHWFESGLNNAGLSLVATYNANVPALENLLRQKGGDLSAFNAACEALARMSANERRQALERLASP